MVTIFRVERPDGTGMYRNSGAGVDFRPGFGEAILKAENVEDLDLYCCHPEPYRDGLLMLQLRAANGRSAQFCGLLFGFGSLAQFEKWVFSDRLRKELEGYGFVLSVYEVPERRAFVGSTQAVFDRGCARLVERRSLVDYEVPGNLN